MDGHSTLTALVDLAEELGISIRTAPRGSDGAGQSGGAVVRVRGRTVVFLDPVASTADQVFVLAGALRGRGELEDRFLPPELRELLDDSGS